MHSIRAVLLLLAILGPLFLACLGCGPSRPTLVPVSGKVTFGGGAWPKKGTIYFTVKKAADGYPQRPGYADFGPDGSYAVTSYDTPGDGLHPGTYAVRIECWEVEPNMEGKPTKSYVPGKFQNADTSELTLEVLPTDGAKTGVDFDVPKM